MCDSMCSGRETYIDMIRPWSGPGRGGFSPSVSYLQAGASLDSLNAWEEERRGIRWEWKCGMQACCAVLCRQSALCFAVLCRHAVLCWCVRPIRVTVHVSSSVERGVEESDS